MDSLVELLGAELLGVVVIGDAEGATEALDTAGSTGCKFCAHNFAQLFLGVVHFLSLLISVLLRLVVAARDCTQHLSVEPLLRAELTSRGLLIV